MVVARKDRDLLQIVIRPRKSSWDGEINAIRVIRPQGGSSLLVSCDGPRYNIHKYYGILTVGYLGNDQAEFEQVCRGWYRGFHRSAHAKRRRQVGA